MIAAVLAALCMLAVRIPHEYRRQRLEDDRLALEITDGRLGQLKPAA